MTIFICLNLSFVWNSNFFSFFTIQAFRNYPEKFLAQCGMWYRNAVFFCCFCFFNFQIPLACFYEIKTTTFQIIELVRAINKFCLWSKKELVSICGLSFFVVFFFAAAMGKVSIALFGFSAKYPQSTLPQISEMQIKTKVHKDKDKEIRPLVLTPRTK